MVMPDGEVKARTKGTPQGGVISPLLANLFMHYVFDKWLVKYYPKVPGCRYADDGILHSRSEAEAIEMREILRKRFAECGLEMHPKKTRIIYCKDGSRKGNYEHTMFDFLGYTFRRRVVKNTKRNSLFVSFTPAASKTALKAMRREIRASGIRNKADWSIEQIAKWLNPKLNGWINYYGKYTCSALFGLFRHINITLIKWARGKYKKLRWQKTKAHQFLEEMAKRSPKLFAHWKREMAGAFA